MFEVRKISDERAGEVRKASFRTCEAVCPEQLARALEEL